MLGEGSSLGVLGGGVIIGCVRGGSSLGVLGGGVIIGCVRGTGHHWVC